MNPTDKYKYCNHHHELSDKHELVDFGDGEFVANKEAIPLLKALNEVGLRTRSHHIDEEEHAFVCILLDNAQIEVKRVFEHDANRTKYNGRMELLISWKKINQRRKTKANCSRGLHPGQCIGPGQSNGGSLRPMTG